MWDFINIVWELLKNTLLEFLFEQSSLVRNSNWSSILHNICTSI